jgi:PadR family transcriptional regulator, regulatory protein PadR
MRVGADAYGVTIRSEIEDRTGRDPAPGALYTTLDRLEEKGLVTSRFGDPTPQRGGRPKRYFRIAAAGIEAVARAQTFLSKSHGRIATARNRICLTTTFANGYCHWT